MSLAFLFSLWACGCEEPVSSSTAGAVAQTWDLAPASHPLVLLRVGAHQHICSGTDHEVLATGHFGTICAYCLPCTYIKEFFSVAQSKFSFVHKHKRLDILAHSKKDSKSFWFQFPLTETVPFSLAVHVYGIWCGLLDILLNQSGRFKPFDKRWLFKI